MTDRKPLMAMPDGEREAALAARGLGTDLIPLDASPAEWRAAMEDQKPAPVAPTGPASGAVVNQTLTRVGAVVAVVLASIPALVAAGVALPSWLVAVAASILGVLTALGIASPGVRKAP